MFCETLLHYRFETSSDVQPQLEGGESFQDSSVNQSEEEKSLYEDKVSRYVKESFAYIFDNLRSGFSQIPDIIKEQINIPEVKLARCPNFKSRKGKEIKLSSDAIFVGTNYDYSKRSLDIFFIETDEEGRVVNPFLGALVTNYGVTCYPSIIYSRKNKFDTIVEGVDALKIILRANG